LLLPLLGIVVLAVYLQRWLIRPISALHWASQQVAEGRLDARVEIGHGDELEAVGREFNRMAGALQRHEETQRTEIRRRTQELRHSELQARRMHDSISATMEAIAVQIRAALDGLREEISRAGANSPKIQQHRAVLRALAEDLEDLASIGAAGAALELRQVDLAPLLEGVRRLLEPLAELHGVRVELPAGELPSVVADRARLKQILYGLLSNAREDGATRIAISDEGRGPILQEHSGIFYLLEAKPAEAPEDRIGLALPVIKGLVELHGGEIHVEGERGQGSTFAFTLPDREPPQSGASQG